jgi:phosphotransferase system enzyme I (PtsP)
VEANYQRILQEVSVASNLSEISDIIARRVKEALGLDACAVYLFDNDADQYVLMGSVGMDGSSGHRKRLDRHAGVLGLVDERKELVTLTGPAAHPPEHPLIAGNDAPFEAFVGMPLVHLQRVLGVLAGWKKASRKFEPNELTFIVTVASQLASIVGDAIATDEIEHLLRGERRERDFVEGAPAAPGLTVGIATVLKPTARPSVIAGARVEDASVEEAALRAAIAAACRELESDGARLAAALAGDAREMVDAHLLLLRDDLLVTDTLERIRAGSGASWAWQETISHYVRVFKRMADAAFRAKADDIRELGQRVLLQLESGHSEARTHPERCILVADRVGITDIAAVPAGRLAGIVCRRGSALSHTAVLARALGVPAVVRLGSLPGSLIDGCTMAIDGDLGRVYVNPSPATVDTFEKAGTERRASAEAFAVQRGLPARTPDDVSVPLLANIGLSSDLGAVLAGEADGIGLLRTEYQFLLHEGFPIEEEQYLYYLGVLKSLAPKPVAIRTLDVGGDKILSYFPISEDNPMLGCRGIRFSLAHPEIFLIQLRALLRANAMHGNLQVLFPMISRASELDAALHLLNRAHRELLEEGTPSAVPKVGVMVEVPSAVYLTKTLADRVAFFSIGSNDLTQYILAVDRTNAEVANPDDALHPAVLDAMYRVAVDAHAQNRPVSVCGELAGDPAGALVLLGLGVDTLSMSPAALAQVKRVIRTFTSERARALAMESLGLDDGHAVRQHLTRALRAAGVLESDSPVLEGDSEGRGALCLDEITE